METPRRRWLIHLPDGWRDSTFTPPASLAEVRAWYPAALAIEPENEGEEPAPTPKAWPADDRITCRQCRHLAGVRCNPAKLGRFKHRASWYEPCLERLHRCYAFAPLPDDENQAPGAERWPDMTWMMRAAA